MAITNRYLTTNVAPIYTSVGNTAVTTAYFCNLDATAKTFTLFLIPSGSPGGANNCIYSGVQVASQDTYVIDMEKIMLGPGDVIAANCSANTSIVATLSYIGI